MEVGGRLNAFSERTIIMLQVILATLASCRDIPCHGRYSMVCGTRLTRKDGVISIWLFTS
jgi:hypothetical protein